MKRYIILIFFCSIILHANRPILYAETGRGFNFGVSVGTFPFVWSNNGIKTLNSLCLSGRIGCQFTRHFGIIGELAYSYARSYTKTTSTWNEYWESQETNHTTIPVTLSLIYSEPISERFTAYIGLGFGYYQMKHKDFYNRNNGTLQSWTDADKINTLVPHFSLGSEFSIFPKIKIFYEIKKTIGKARFEYELYGGATNIERDDYFTGTEMKIGLKFYLRD
jgi:opacity protein-like surface antigen